MAQPNNITVYEKPISETLHTDCKTVINLFVG